MQQEKGRECLRHVEDVGTVNFRRSTRARHMRLRVDPEGISAILPADYPESLALKFIQQKKAWIQRTLQRQEKIGRERTVILPSDNFTTRFHTLHMYTHTRATIKSVVGKKMIRIWYPDYADPADERIQQVVRRAVEEAWRTEAKRFLPGRVKELASLHNYQYNNLTIKNAKSRWGSCSGKNNINLNLQLMRLPEALCDYVILHELVHTRHKHHQKAFWQELERVLPGARKLDKALNAYHLRYW